MHAFVQARNQPAGAVRRAECGTHIVTTPCEFGSRRSPLQRCWARVLLAAPRTCNAMKNASVRSFVLARKTESGKARSKSLQELLAYLTIEQEGIVGVAAPLSCRNPKNPRPRMSSGATRNGAPRPRHRERPEAAPLRPERPPCAPGLGSKTPSGSPGADRGYRTPLRGWASKGSPNSRYSSSTA